MACDTYSKRCWFTFPTRTQVEQPIIWQMSRKFPDVSFDIRQASVQNEIVPYRGGRFYFTAGEAGHRLARLAGSLYSEDTLDYFRLGRLDPGNRGRRNKGLDGGGWRVHTAFRRKTLRRMKCF